jgi:hypothetical protein
VTREELEAESNWQATLESTSPNARTRHVCIMRTVSVGHFYEHEVDYQGVYSYGATSTYDAKGIAHAIKIGKLKLVAGTLPEAQS